MLNSFHKKCCQKKLRYFLTKIIFFWFRPIECLFIWKQTQCRLKSYVAIIYKIRHKIKSQNSKLTFLFNRKSSVNHSNRSGSSSSSNNSIETKTRNPKNPKKFQRLTLENVLLGPVEIKKHSESFPTNFHSVSPDHISSESSVGDPIFYYIKSSHDCPCAYHDQVFIMIIRQLEKQLSNDFQMFF